MRELVTAVMELVAAALLAGSAWMFAWQVTPALGPLAAAVVLISASAVFTVADERRRDSEGAA